MHGYYAGVGGGKLGLSRHTQRNAGLLLWGRESNTWSDASGDAGEDQQVGLLGLAAGPSGTRPYKPACKHYFHLGWVGVTANVRWLEIPDFLFGWVGLDFSGDDARGAPRAGPSTPGSEETEDGA